MRFLAIACGVLLLLGGCQTDQPRQRTADEAEMFGPASMRIHPIFTQISDWTGDGKPDGVEALIEFQDQFGDPTKSTGQVIFELYDYRRASPDPRGDRFVNPWVGSLKTIDDQRQHWNRTSRTYSFQLACPQIQSDRPYVLTAIFQLSGGGRFFDRVVLEPPSRERSREPATTQTVWP